MAPRLTTSQRPDGLKLMRSTFEVTSILDQPLSKRPVVGWSASSWAASLCFKVREEPQIGQRRQAHANLLFSHQVAETAAVDEMHCRRGFSGCSARWLTEITTSDHDRSLSTGVGSVTLKQCDVAPRDSRGRLAPFGLHSDGC